MKDFPLDAVIMIHRDGIGSAIAAVAIATFLLFGLGYLLFVRRSKFVIGFVLFQIPLFLFTLGYAVYTSSVQIIQVDFWMRVCFSGAVMLPPGFHWLVETAAGEKHPRVHRTFIVICLALVLLIWLDGRWVITHDMHIRTHASMITGPGFPVVMTLVCGMILRSFFVLVKHTYKNTRFSYLHALFVVGFAVWVLSGASEGLAALGLLRTGFHPWVGAVFILLMLMAGVLGRLVNEQTCTSRALAHRIQELDSILRTVNDGILLFDTHGRVLATNAALMASAGVSDENWTGRNLFDGGTLQGGHETILSYLGYTVQTLKQDIQALASKAQAYKKISLSLPGSPDSFFERILTPVRDTDGVIDAWLMTLHDITEERNMVQLRKDMTRMLVHDMRAPLSVLHCSLEGMAHNLESVKRQCVDQDINDFGHLLASARQGSDHMLHMVTQLLDISKLESGKMLLQPQALDVAVIFRKAIDQLLPLAIEAKLKIEVDVPPDLPNLYADPDFTLRILSNLLDNAIKFSPDGERIRVWARSDYENGAQWPLVLGVTDCGPGIPSEMQARIFNKFEQGVPQKSRRRGTGLGLTFCKLAVEAHGGQIAVESVVGKGSTFVIRMPLEPVGNLR